MSRELLLINFPIEPIHFPTKVIFRGSTVHISMQIIIFFFLYGYDDPGKIREKKEKKERTVHCSCSPIVVIMIAMLYTSYAGLIFFGGVAGNSPLLVLERMLTSTHERSPFDSKHQQAAAARRLLRRLLSSAYRHNHTLKAGLLGTSTSSTSISSSSSNSLASTHLTSCKKVCAQPALGELKELE